MMTSWRSTLPPPPADASDETEEVIHELAVAAPEGDAPSSIAIVGLKPTRSGSWAASLKNGKREADDEFAAVDGDASSTMPLPVAVESRKPTDTWPRAEPADNKVVPTPGELT